MPRAPECRTAPPPGPWVRDPSRPPWAAVLAGVVAIIGALPFALLVAAVRLLTRHDRLTLVCCLPVAVVLGGAVLASDGWNPSVLVLLVPSSAALLAPSVGRWIDVRAAD